MAILTKIADKFHYDDGPNAALANRLLGKTFASLIPLFDDGGQKPNANIILKKYLV